MPDLPILTLERLEKLAREQTSRLNRIQAFIASTNADILAAREGILTVQEVRRRDIVKRVEKRYLAYLIRAMQQTLHQELLPLLKNCTDTVNAIREVVASAQALEEGENGYQQNDRGTARGAGMS